MSEISYEQMKEVFEINEDDLIRKLEENLKPCPFCGGKGFLQNMGFPHWIYCEDCGAMIHGREYGEINGMVYSALAWNRRKEGSQEQTAEEETKINVYENMWNTLKETIEAKGYGWTSNNSFLADMNQIERLQKGIPEEDYEEEETEEDE